MGASPSPFVCEPLVSVHPLLFSLLFHLVLSPVVPQEEAEKDEEEYVIALGYQGGVSSEFHLRSFLRTLGQSPA